MSIRAHFYRPVLDSAGNIRTNLSVRVLTPGTETPIPETIFQFPEGSAALTQPLVFTNGVIDFYLDQPKRVRLGVTVGTAAEIFFDDVDVLWGEHNAASVAFTPTGTLSSSNVQDALVEVADEASTALADHKNSTIDAHDASAISFIATGDLASNNVQDALDELDTEKAKTTHAHGVLPFLVKTTDYTLSATDQVVFFDGATLTATLPTAVGVAGRQYLIKNLNATTLTVDAVAGTIDGVATRILAQYDAITVISDGTNWGVV